MNRRSALAGLATTFGCAQTSGEGAVSTGVGLAVAPTATFAGYGATPEVLFVPGGIMGTIDAMGDAPTLDWLRAKAEAARYAASVCMAPLCSAQPAFCAATG